MSCTQHTEALTGKTLLQICCLNPAASEPLSTSVVAEVATSALDMRSKAKSRDDIMALMHVIYSGDDALPLQQDTQL